MSSATAVKAEGPDTTPSAKRNADQAERLDFAAFAYTVAHELRAPLRAAYAHASLAGKKAGDQAAHLAEMQQALQRMDRVIQRTYAFAAAQRPESIDLAEVLGEACPEARVEGRLPSLHAPRTHIHATVVEAVANALEHGGGAVVRAVPDGIEVLDRGASDLPDDPFAFLPPGRHGRGGGLALARHLLEAAGGSIHLVGGPGGRACRIVLPPAWSPPAKIVR